MKKLILVNGIPASGKSSVAKIISEHFNAPVLSLDEIKEPFMAQFADIIDRSLNRKLGYAAYKSMFNIVRDAPTNTLFVLDAWFGFRDKSILSEYITMADSPAILEVWNKISPELVSERYKSRCVCRVKGHPGEEYIPELMLLAGKARPMALSEVYTVDQDLRCDDRDLIGWISQHLK